MPGGACLPRSMKPASLPTDQGSLMLALLGRRRSGTTVRRFYTGPSPRLGPPLAGAPLILILLRLRCSVSFGDSLRISTRRIKARISGRELKSRVGGPERWRVYWTCQLMHQEAVEPFVTSGSHAILLWVDGNLRDAAESGGRPRSRLPAGKTGTVAL